MDQAQIVAKPLHQGTGDGNTAFERIMSRFCPHLISQRGQQTMLGMNPFLPSVEEQKASSTVGVLCLSRSEARLPDQRRLLVSQNCGQRHTVQRFVTDPAI